MGAEAFFAEGPGPSTFVDAERDVFQLTAAFAADSASTSEMGKLFWRYASALRLDERGRDSSCPRAELQGISEGARTAEQIAVHPIRN